MFFSAQAAYVPESNAANLLLYSVDLRVEAGDGWAGASRCCGTLGGGASFTSKKRFGGYDLARRLSPTSQPCHKKSLNLTTPDQRCVKENKAFSPGNRVFPVCPRGERRGLRIRRSPVRIKPGALSIFPLLPRKNQGLKGCG